ncbi:MAG: YabP/YqfC family sporulation protein [Clostridiales bacterium]|nr:YabP/YqfC family sporulation protein [Clostridiales bacterium]
MLGRKLADGLELPEEALNDTPLMTVCGNGSIVDQNYRRITAFCGREVVLATKCGRLCVRGEGLGLEYIKKDIVKIKGKICTILFM